MPIKKKIKFNADRIVSICAIIVSVGTLFMIFYQTDLVRREQKASVMPYLKISFSNGFDGENRYQQLQLTNQGLGPAKVEEIRIITPDTTLTKNPLSYIEDKVNDSILYKVIRADLVSPGRLIAAKERVEMLRLKNNNSENFLIKTFKFPDLYKTFLPIELNGNNIIEIEYASIYDDRWVVRSDGDQPKALN